MDISYITSRACPGGFNDPEEYLPMCYRCSNYSPHLHGNRCPNCGQEYVFSYVSFEILPLSEFVPEEGIADQEAERLLMAPPKMNDYGQPDQFIHEVMVKKCELGSDYNLSFFRTSSTPSRPAWTATRCGPSIPARSSSSRGRVRCGRATIGTCCRSCR